MPVLKKGSSGPEVVKLQKRLEELGFTPGVIDGVFGPATEVAVKAFQNSKGLAVDGIAGPLTQRALGLVIETSPPYMEKPRRLFNTVSAIVSSAFSNLTSSSVVIATPRGAINAQKGADLSHQELSGVVIHNIDLSGVNLEGANLSFADLRGVSLAAANLRGANLEGVNLEGANLSQAVFQGANLTSANLENTVRLGTDFSGVVGWSMGTDSGIRTDKPAGGAQ